MPAARRCLVGLVATLAMCAPVAAQTLPVQGDVNGSGVTDLSDVIYLASYLFLGGPPPAPVAPYSLDDGNAAEPPDFEDGFYKGLDLARAARDQYGLNATVESVGDHLYDWKARVGRELKGLDLTTAVQSQYGSDYILVAVGVHRFDWKAVRIADLDGYILPVMPIANEYFLDIDAVRTGLANFKSTLGAVQAWYNARVEGRLRMLTPIIIPPTRAAADWNALSDLSADEDHRYDFMNAGITAAKTVLPVPGPNLRIVISPYTGDSADVWLGAASTGGYAIAPPRATSLSCPATGPMSPECSDAAYAIGHELGHTFGLGHTCDDYASHPHCGESIMQTGKPPSAILLQFEVCKVLETPFFR